MKKRKHASWGNVTPHGRPPLQDEAKLGLADGVMPAKDDSYFLLRAPLEAIGAGELLVGPPVRDVGPSIWWPDDLAWCVATEVDFRWTYVGGTRACIDNVLANPRLEALPADLRQRGDCFSDRFNRSVKPY